MSLCITQAKTQPSQPTAELKYFMAFVARSPSGPTSAALLLFHLRCIRNTNCHQRHRYYLACQALWCCFAQMILTSLELRVCGEMHNMWPLPCGPLQATGWTSVYGSSVQWGKWIDFLAFASQNLKFTGLSHLGKTITF